jgi:hypothetical protein
MIKVSTVYTRSGQKVITDITNYCKSVTWSGDKEQVARKLEVALAYAIWDKNQQNAQIGPGTLVWFEEDGAELFRGIVFTREINSGSEELTFTAFDYMNYLLKSKGTYNFYKTTPESIVKTVCGDAQITIGDIGTTGYTVSFVAQSKSFYEIIMQAYTYVWHYNGAKYNFMPYMDKDTLNIMNMGQLFDSNYVLKPYTNIGSTTYNDTIENMVNKVNVYNDKGQYLGTQWQRDWISFYGVLQDVYEAQDDKNPLDIAKTKLHGVDQTVKITALGDSRCRTGYAVKCQIPYVQDLQDITLYIDSDSHTWEVATNKHTMDLGLNFNCVMHLVEG